MNILAVCSALDKTYLALEYESKIYSEIIKSDKNYHSLYLISKIKSLFEKENISFKKLNAITVNCGPGSFTGIRVALTVSKVMAGELNIPLIPLNTAEILLTASECEVLIMDARRDMYFIADKNKIELVYKDNVPKDINKKIISDKNSSKHFSNTISYEDLDYDLGCVMLKLAKDKYNNTHDKEAFNYLKVKANYIQTPPVFA